MGYFKTGLFGGGKLRFTDGEEFRLTIKGMFQPVWTWKNVRNEKLLKVIPHRKTVAIKDDGNVQKLNALKLSVVAMLSWHEILQTSKKARAMVAVGAPAT